MAKSPQLRPGRHARPECAGSVVFAVYAPIGTDPALSRHPKSTQPTIETHPLVKALREVAAHGVNVSALIDLYEDFTWLVEIPAGRPLQAAIVSAWKQDMSQPQALAGFLQRVHARFPRSTPVLAIEGHGGAFLPDIDFNRLTPSSTTRNETTNPASELHWTHNGGGATFGPGSDPSLPVNSPILPVNSPILPVNSPILPAGHLPMSTWAVGEALRLADAAKVPRPALIHFNNCFNASFELLHTIARWTEVAAGYANYDYYTAGAAYPKVFQWLAGRSGVTALDLARKFVEMNGVTVRATPGQPSIGAAVLLDGMKPATAALERLATLLVAELRNGPAADRNAAREAVRKAAIAAQHYDTQPGFALEVPDQFIDVADFAQALMDVYPKASVRSAARTLRDAVTGARVYGDTGAPYMDKAVTWDFSDERLGLNLFFPDPDLRGLWDWRSPYYLSGRVDPAKPPAHKHVIRFLADRPGGKRPPWVEFIVAFHETTPFQAFLAPLPFFFPLSGGEKTYQPPPAQPAPPIRKLPDEGGDPQQQQPPAGTVG